MTTLAQLDAVLTHGGLAAAGTAAIAIPILIHLLTRLRRRPQAWGAMRFLIEAYRKHRSRLQLEQLLLLLVRCLVLIVFGLALASPVLSGCASTMFGAMGRSGRVVCLVIDDSLTTQARDGGATRFEALRETALALLDALEPDDRVSVWRAARPARAMLDPAAGPQTRSITLGVPGIDHAAVRRAIEQMQPRYSRADLPAALALVSESLEQDDTAAQLPADQVVVVLLSDLAAGSLDLSEQPPAGVAALGERAKLLVARPMPGVGNVQVLSVRPGRHMVLVEPDAVTSVPIELRLRRFIDETPDRLTGVELSVLPDGAEQARQSPNASEGNGRAQPIFVRREHRWSVGQSIATINVDVPLTGLLPGVSGTSSARLTVTMRARIDPGTMSDALEADNQRWLILELRNRLRVGLVDGSSAPLADDPGAPGLAPHRWLTLALAPRSGPTGTAGVQGPIELVDLNASALDAQLVATLDAAMVLRPDRLDHAGWRMLADLVERGGLVWVFVPPNDVPAAWAATMSEQLGLDWQLGLEPVTRGQTPVGSDAAPGSPDASRRPPATASAWSLALNEQVPDALRLLAADWDALLRPIQVSKRLELTARAGASADDAVWIRLDDADRSPLLVSAAPGTRSGGGRVMLLATAIDPAWTNLPTKPLFVPLLHETLRGVLGESPEAARLSAGVVGVTPLLGRRWDGAQRLVPVRAQIGENKGVLLRRADQGLVPISPLDKPGVYRAVPELAGRKLAMNVDAEAADTRTIDQQRLVRWLSAVADWQWLDATEPAKALMAHPRSLSLAWLLLWTTLGLVMLETCLARWFSHAKQ